MKYKTLKRVTKYYDEKFTKEKETNEIHININDVNIQIIGQQCGNVLNEPYIEIITKECSYGMDFNIFIKKLTGK